MRSPKGRLELTWMGKDMALIPTAHGKYDYEWVDPADPPTCGSPAARRDHRRNFEVVLSASTLPPVWHVGQYATV